MCERPVYVNAVLGQPDATRRALAKMTSILSHLSAVLFILLALSWACSTAPSEPQHPGDNASQEQLNKYYADLWQYITFVTRPRFGKRWDDFGIENNHSL
ncbi:pancreatic prohormone [Pelobates cultripes]|uniref:Pancreatic prohormone n=1 Tax=Pelobates cultripes TaxID=61616 RepID=A0AAD1SJE5_PELCU|nr:pancreatic prohormone [Pelobates cultripes]